MKKIAITLLFLSATQITLANDPSTVLSYKKNLQTDLVVKSAIAPEAITIAESGNQIAYIAKNETDMKSAPPTRAWLVKKMDNKWQEPVTLPWSGMVTSVTFANQDKWLVVSNSHGTFNGYLKIVENFFKDREKIGDLEGFKHRIEIYDAQKPSKKLYSMRPEDFGLKKPEMLKHARISADGKLLTFYTHGYEDQRGVYVYDFATKITQHLGLSDDKHPTFTPDSTKILFHMQSGGNSFNGYGQSERSMIGYYDLQNLNESGKPQRIMMDENVEASTYVYHKHPMVYPGTDLLFFHAMASPEGAKKIYVRQLAPNSQIYKLSDIISGQTELKGVKHINSSINGDGIYFIAKESGAPKYEARELDKYSENRRTIYVYDVKNIYHISDEQVQKIKEFVNR